MQRIQNHLLLQCKLDALLYGLFNLSTLSREKNKFRIDIRGINPEDHGIAFCDVPHGAQLKKRYTGWRYGILRAFRNAGYQV